MPEKMSGGILEQTWKLLKTIGAYDCVVGTTSGIAFALALWKRIGFLDPPIVAIHCGLLNNPYSWAKKKLTLNLLQHVHTVFFGEAERLKLIQMFPGIDDNIFINQFGVDEKFWRPSPGDRQESDFILAIGNDGRRDYKTLVMAAKKLSVEVKILTSIPLPSDLPKNITLIKSSWHDVAISDRELRSLYQKAKCVVVTLQQSHQPSGQSVALQAMACGCPVALTRTQGIWSKETLVDGHNVVFMKPFDVNSVVAAIQKIRKADTLRQKLSKTGRETVKKTAASNHFAERMELICLDAVKRG